MPWYPSSGWVSLADQFFAGAVKADRAELITE